eukprot:6194546-Pleurochrysis_carterae.AAC.1
MRRGSDSSSDCSAVTSNACIPKKRSEERSQRGHINSPRGAHGGKGLLENMYPIRHATQATSDGKAKVHLMSIREASVARGIRLSI